MRIIYSLLFVFGIQLIANGQIIETAPSFNGALIKKSTQIKNNQQAAPRNVEALSLPFFDDFSGKGPYPNVEKWIDKNVFINSTLAYQAPSVGVATFDGINSSGTPYGGGFGEADFLTSNLIDLDPYSTTDNVYLSFWLQRKGFGDKPEAADAFFLEFKNNTNTWDTIASYSGFGTGTASDTLEDFQFYAFKIKDAKYFHDAFQFRFKNQNNRSGVIDLWHLDYVKLEANTNDNDNFDDIAFTQLPQSILKNYTNMPRSHFKNFETQEMRDTIEASLFNHFPTTEALTTSTAVLEESSTNESFPEFTILDGAENNFTSKERRTKIRVNPLFNTYIQEIESNFSNEDSLIFTMKYELTQNGQSPLALENDVVTNRTVLHNYFSYDDGTAESTIVAQNIGTEIAVKFKANISDTLRAIQIHFPHLINDVSNQLFNFKVYVGELDNEAEYKAVFKKPFYADVKFDTLQGFTTYTLLDNVDSLAQPLFLPAGDFYISWQQVTSTEIPVGLDKNNPLGTQHAFFTTTNGDVWNPFPSSIKGAIMIRPVVGDFTPQSTSTAVQEIKSLSDWMEVYPNPTNDRLFFNLKNGSFQDYEIILFNSVGQSVLRTRLDNQLSLSNFPNGMYFAKIRNTITNELRTHKFILNK